MELLTWELSVLCRAVAYKNLSSAATHVGLSQPQLSRIVQRVEKQLQIQLLDRSSRRASTWLPIAFQLAEIYSLQIKNLEQRLQALTQPKEITNLKIGLLEGLIPVVVPFAKSIWEKFSPKEMVVDVHDLSRLEELYFKGEFDFIFTSHEPGRRKLPFSKIIGYQSLDLVNKGDGPWIMSPFELATQRQKLKKEMRSIIVSNSLEWRRRWLENGSGKGTLPSALKRESSKAELHPVYLIGADQINDSLWAAIDKIKI